MRFKSRPAALVAAVSAALAAAATALVAVTLSAGPASADTGTGYLRTSGRNIVDSAGKVVRLTGINWFGMETDNKTFHGLWAGAPATWKGQLDRMASLGFNTLRVPYSGDALKPGAAATGINDFTNPDLVGLSPLQILDKVVAYAGTKGMRVILDRHRPTAAGQTPLWYTATVSEASMIADWQMLAARYAGNPTVIGADLFNEPHAEGTDPNATGACWGCDVQARDWRLAAERIGNAVLQTNPNWLIFVEGVSCLSGGVANVWDNIPDDPMACDWWGGNLSAAIDKPVRLNVANRLVYSPHEYGISVYDRQSWFNDPNFPNNLPAVWDSFWGKIAKQNVAPIMIGEFGSTLANPLDVQWLTKLMAYIGDNGLSFTYWSWNPNSGDTGGIALDDWYSINQTKYNILQPYLNPPTTNPSPTSSASPSPSRSASPSPSVSPSRSASPSPSASPSGNGGCTKLVTITNAWQGGYQAEVKVTNTSTSTISPWTVTWTVPSGVTLTNGWNATVTQSGTTITAAAPSWAQSLAPGNFVTIGFTATGPSSPGPSNVKLNGVTCL
ncbi:cellulase family glycosylhydrolase [Catellatospora sp. KI3]|uniref:cellulase family glycosylhydrolase n=1 Tax=Catellatospora sp. KI3 TaxID=3041620 RepID=UPI0024829B80|nr:cellulase family glycosylhydrolase [Catellatospora sp. KI3]MDI1459365.1 cellulase family glycosylhydrolase [Catellatospora sp. KI3]